jgi:tetratricopeptide (TPR) repeat protein
MDVRTIQHQCSTRSVERKSTSTPSTTATTISEDDIAPFEQRHNSVSMDSLSNEGSTLEQQQQLEQQVVVVIAPDDAHASRQLQQQAPLELKFTDQQLEECHDEWDAMDAEAQDYERKEEYDQALACYERVLLARSHYLGQHHIDVAKSLINAGRVMELQGNTEGGLDLYRVAHAIYSGKVVSDDFKVCPQDAETILELVPSWMEQGRYEEAVAFLTKCLDLTDANNDDEPDKTCAHIHLALGRAYVGMREYTAATVCLVEAAKNDGDEEEIFGLLQRVEFLQREDAEARAWSSEYGSASDSDSIPPRKLSRSSSGDRVPGVKLNAETESPSVSSGYCPEEEKRPDPITVGPAQRRGLATSASSFGSDFFSDDSGPELPPITIDPIPDEDETETEGLNVSHQTYMTPVTVENVALESSGEKVHRLTNPASPEKASTPEAPRALASPTSTQDSKKQAGGSRSGRVLRIPSPRRKKAERDGLSPRSKKAERDGPQSPRKKKNQSTERSIIARTISDQFRRPRRGGFSSLTEEKDACSEDNPESLSSFQEIDEGYQSSFDGPVRSIALRSGSWEETISQITVMIEDPPSSHDSNDGWWWGVTSEGFGRWFPTHLVSPAVEAAEGFLSAKSIHSKARPAPLDFISDDELSKDEVPVGNEANTLQVSVSAKLNISNVSVAPETEEIEYLLSVETPTSPRHESPRHENFALSPTSRTQHSESDKIDLASEIVDLGELLTIQHRDLGKSHPEVAATLFTLAVLHSRNGSTPLATESAIEALRVQKVTGNLKDGARSLHFIAGMHLHQKQYKAALTYYAECLRIERTVFGYNSEETAKTLNFIGTVHSFENEFGLAMTSHQEALQILKECYGENLKHPLVSETLCQIGAVYYRERNSPSTMQTKTGDYDTFIETGMLDVIGRAHEDRGSYKMAISFFEEKLQFLKNRGAEVETPMEVSATLNSLGMLSTRNGLFVAAIDYYENALNIQKELGCDEVYVASSQVLKGTVEFQMGNWRKAVKMLVDAHAVLEDELGGEHQTVAATLYQIGVVQNALCEVDEAITALEDAKSIQNKLLGKDHPATLRTRRQIGDMFAVYETELDSSLEEFNDILATQLRIHGDKHPNVAETLHSIGCAQSRKGDYPRALRTLEECYYMRVEFLGWDHPLQGSTLHEIVQIHLKGGRLKKALHISEVVLGIRKEALGDGHVDVARTLTTKGSCLVAQGKFAAAMQCFKEALRISQAAVGEKHPSVANVYTEMGAMYLGQCEFEEARRDIEKALELYRGCNLEEDHPGIRDAVAKLERVDRDEMLYV